MSLVRLRTNFSNIWGYWKAWQENKTTKLIFEAPNTVTTVGLLSEKVLLNVNKNWHKKNLTPCKTECALASFYIILKAYQGNTWKTGCDGENKLNYFPVPLCKNLLIFRINSVSKAFIPENKAIYKKQVFLPEHFWHLYSCQPETIWIGIVITSATTMAFNKRSWAEFF